MRAVFQGLGAGLLAFAIGAGAAPVSAGETELAVLTSYIGNWQGEGALVGGDQPEPFRCRLAVAKGNQTKVTYTGRCSLVSANLSISGTIAFNDESQRYEAAMSSNAGFTGLAIGKLTGQQITFDLRERQRDQSGSDVRIGSQIVLVNDGITVNFEVEFNNSGDVLTASVPFSR
ncbi:heme-binding beta-barrel domain-containing protein [Devosia sp. SL43]|uniref:heme-binding beta-barrel domain-containing protein n=1 Tax=Devosia sp. SL43 TaxID=2806348 RepID=UPI001F3FB65C|nr:heme-binding beta-barrel domain-containing protein [Devosia sp. SL43]UJW84257.1 FABP family protein [Devosia sp. SL43]